MDSAAASVGHARKHASKDESVQKQLADMAKGDMSAEVRNCYAIPALMRCYLKSLFLTCSLRGAKSTADLRQVNGDPEHGESGGGREAQTRRCS